MDLLSEFNQQVLAYQDDAFTLAWYLCGSDECAEAITQAAVEEAFIHFSARPADCWLLFFELVVRIARRVWISDASGNERVAMTLVDVLGLNYQEASLVSRCSLTEMSRRVAQARRKQNESIVEEPVNVSV